METCANCGRTIGNLETPHVFNEHVVCAACRSVLTASPLPQPTPQPVETLTHADAVGWDGSHTSRVSFERPGRPRPRPFVDYLFIPRMAFLGLFIFGIWMDVKSESHDHTMTTIFFAGWILLGIAKHVLKAQHQQSSS